MRRPTPRAPRRGCSRALRQVLHAATDADLGFFIVRAQPTAIVGPTDATGAAPQAFAPNTETLEVDGVRVSLGRDSAVVLDDTTAQVRVQVGQVLVVIEAVSESQPQPSQGKTAETGDARVTNLAERRTR